MKFGGIWTGVIVTQVAVTLVFVALAGVLGWGLMNNGGDRRTSFPEAEYVALRLNLERDPAAAEAESPEVDAQFRNRLGALYLEFEARLAAEPGVQAVTYASRLPGSNLMSLRLEVEGDTRQPPMPEYVQTASTGVNVFDVFQAPIVAGRGFTEADLLPGRDVAVVDQTFVRLVLFGQDAIGRRVRVPAEDGKAPGPWIEIVGVVRDLTDPKDKLLHEAAIFRPATVEATRPLYVAVHAQGDLSAMMPRLRFIAADVDPSLRLDELMTFDQLREVDLVALEFFARLSTGIGAVALLLAMAGVYALMSFTVSRQTTEIGIRVALGANPRRIVWSTFSRALAQVGLGLAVGIVPALAVVAITGREVTTGRASGAIVTLAVTFMLAVTVAACAMPARRALRIQPTDALKTT
jgi:hypothetical protein